MDFQLFIDNCDIVMCPSYGNCSSCEECYDYMMAQQQEE